MIQRIQTLYLLLVAALMGVTLLAPLAKFTADGVSMELTAFGLAALDGDGTGMVAPLFFMGAVLSLCVALPLVIIFLFKKRGLQARLCIMQLILLILAQGAIAYYIFKAPSMADITVVDAVSYGVAAVMPLVSVVLVLLAWRAISKDEALVKSLDRIR